jgi:hypothetical protein
MLVGAPKASNPSYTLIHPSALRDCLRIRDSLNLGSNKWTQAPKEAPFRRFDGHRPTIEKTFSDFSDSFSTSFGE